MFNPVFKYTRAGNRTVEAANRAPSTGHYLRKRMVTESANIAKKEIQKRVPSNPELGDYKKGFRVSGVQGLNSSLQAAVVHVKPKKRAVKEISYKSSLIYVRGKLTKRSRSSQVLIDNSPWTSDTFPSDRASKDEVTLEYRKVHPREVIEARGRLRRTKTRWERALSAGEKSTAVRRPVGKKDKAQYDVSHTADKLEGLGSKGFGKAKVRRVHWKPGIVRVKRLVGKMAYEDEVIKTLGDPDYHGYLKFGYIKPGPKVPSTQLKSLLKSGRRRRLNK